MKSRLLLIIAILFSTVIFSACSEEEIVPGTASELSSGEGNIKEDRDALRF